MSPASEPPAPAEDLFRILFVCTGNICRSPMAERLMHGGLQNRLGDDIHRVAVESAGTWGHEGAPMEVYAAHALHELGGDPAGFVARELTEQMVVGADLILAATREHRTAAVVLQPRATQRTFTIREFARLAAQVDPGVLPDGDLVARGRALVRASAGRRGRVPMLDPRDDDLADPYGAPADAFRQCAWLLADSLRTPLDLLAPRPDVAGMGDEALSG